jgi:hypothetical protein
MNWTRQEHEDRLILVSFAMPFTCLDHIGYKSGITKDYEMERACKSIVPYNLLYPLLFCMTERDYGNCKGGYLVSRIWSRSATHPIPVLNRKFRK